MKKTIITLSIIIVVFAIIAFSVTFVLIDKNKANIQNIDQQQGDISEENKDDVKEKTIDLLSLYDENDLLIEEITFDGIQIPKISGLKNKEVENKVNEDIKNRFLGLKEKYPDYEFYSGLRGNFANIVSFYVYLSKEVENDDGNTEYYVQNYGLNYELINGELIKIEDVFAKDTNIIDIVRTQFYNELTLDNYCYSFSQEGQKNGPISFEEELYKIVKEFMDSDNTNFCIAPDCLTLYNKEKTAILDFEENTNKIVIYDKYKTQESLFERNDIGRKGIFKCVDTTYYNENFNDTIIGYLEENFWCDVIENSYYPDVPSNIKLKVENVKKDVKQEINKQIEEYRKIAKQNPDKFYVFSNRQTFSPIKYRNPNTNEEGYLDYVEVKNDQLYYSMTKEYYEKEYIKYIASHYRYEYFFMSVYSSLLNDYYIVYDNPINDEKKLEILDYTYKKQTNIYDGNTKEKFDELTDIFIDEYMPEYMNIITDKVVDRFERDQDYNMEYDEIIDLLKTAQFDITQDYININIKGYEELYLQAYYESFPIYMFKENMKNLLYTIY